MNSMQEDKFSLSGTHPFAASFHIAQLFSQDATGLPLTPVSCSMEGCPAIKVHSWHIQPALTEYPGTAKEDIKSNYWIEEEHSPDEHLPSLKIWFLSLMSKIYNTISKKCLLQGLEVAFGCSHVQRGGSSLWVSHVSRQALSQPRAGVCHDLLLLPTFSWLHVHTWTNKRYQINVFPVFFMNFCLKIGGLVILAS